MNREKSVHEPATPALLVCLIFDALVGLYPIAYGGIINIIVTVTMPIPMRLGTRSTFGFAELSFSNGIS